MNWGLLFIVLLVIALALLGLARQSLAATGLPAGRLIYVDTTHWHRLEQPLFSRAHRLTGRPDYLIEDGQEIIPVEVKSGYAPRNGPYSSHVLQLAAYCLLVAETFEQRPSHGVIIYTADPDQAYEIDYTPVLERQLLTSLEEMRTSLRENDAPRNHDQIARCRNCGFNDMCDHSLV
jgi:CRISPR-associated exonuclease Cas4